MERTCSKPFVTILTQLYTLPMFNIHITQRWIQPWTPPHHSRTNMGPLRANAADYIKICIFIEVFLIIIIILTKKKFFLTRQSVHITFFCTRNYMLFDMSVSGCIGGQYMRTGLILFSSQGKVFTYLLDN